MTLRDWSDAFGPVPQYHHGAVYVVGWEGRRELFTLADYVVSSVCGLTVWLLPREPKALPYTA